MDRGYILVKMDRNMMDHGKMGKEMGMEYGIINAKNMMEIGKKTKKMEKDNINGLMETYGKEFGLMVFL